MTSLYDNSSHVLIYHKRQVGVQYVARMEQLSQFSNIDLHVQYNGYTGYATPTNIAMTPYIYVGFIPQSEVKTSATEGWTCNGEEYTFNNCDGNPNSYIVFYLNKENLLYGKQGSSYNSLMFCWYDLATPVSSDDYLPDEFFTQYFEVHHGGCGGFATAQAVEDVVGVAAGLQFCKNFSYCTISCFLTYIIGLVVLRPALTSVLYTCGYSFIPVNNRDVKGWGVY